MTSDTPNDSVASFSIPALKKRKIVSDFDFLINASIGYLPLVDSLTLNSGFSKSYWVDASAKIFGLPVDLSFSSSNNIFTSERSFSYRQFHFSFDYHRLMEDLKTQMTESVIEQIDKKRQELLSPKNLDSLQLYEVLKDSLANLNYQIYINQLRDKAQVMADSAAQGFPIDTTALNKIKEGIATYGKYQATFTKLMEFQDRLFDLRKQFQTDSSILQKKISSIQTLTNKEELLKNASEMGYDFGRSLLPLNFRELSFGVQFLQYSPLTFYDYYSNGLNASYNDGKYILRTAIVKSSPWFTNFQSLTDSLILPKNGGQNVFMLGAGKGDLDGSYSLVSLSFIENKSVLTQEENINQNKWLATYFQRLFLSKKVSFDYEVGKTMVHETTPNNATNSLEDILTKSAGFTSVKYEITKIKANIFIESSLIGSGYFTGGNPYLQPGTANLALGWRQELFHSKLLLDYKVNVSHYLSVNSSGSRQWYQVAQVSYQIGRLGTLSCIVTPYQFSYYQPITDSLNKSNAQYVILNGVFNISIGKKIIFSSLSFSNYASQSSFSDTLFSNETKQLSGSVGTTFGSHRLLLLGNYFIPTQSSSSMMFINSAELTGSIVQNKTISIAIGPKWLGYSTFSDQLGGTAIVNAILGKHFSWNLSISKYFNLERGKQLYSSTISFTTDLTFKL